MNFFGHAWVASWFSEREPFLLGAMLPDFASVLGLAPPTSRHAELSAGIQLHHQTDQAFHETEVFLGLEHGARAELAAAGVSKGARRALAHMGVELLIDAELVRRAPSWSGFELALRYGSSSSCCAELDWRRAPDDAGERLSRLCARLLAVEPLLEPERIAARLVAALAGRPRLALRAEEVAVVRAWLSQQGPRVAARVEPLLEELRCGLRHRACPPATAAAQGQSDSARSS